MIFWKPYYTDIYCDICGETKEKIYFSNEDEVYKYLTEEGWGTARRELGEWIDICPKCMTKCQKGEL